MNKPTILLLSMLLALLGSGHAASSIGMAGLDPGGVVEVRAEAPPADPLLEKIPTAAAPSMKKADILGASGKLTLLRVHDVGSGFGPPADFIDAEVIIRLDTEIGKSFGFQLRSDTNALTHAGMLDLLLDAHANNWTVFINYLSEEGKNNSIMFRLWVTN